MIAVPAPGLAAKKVIFDALFQFLMKSKPFPNRFQTFQYWNNWPARGD